nr:MAG TPA: hypothetical protein [Caudoviricetes sp.]
MEMHNNLISQRLSEALVNLNRIFFDCEKEITLLIEENGANLEKFLEELSDEFEKAEDKVSKLIAISSTFKARKIAENQHNK